MVSIPLASHTMVKSLCRKLCYDAHYPTKTFTKLRASYRMPQGKTQETEKEPRPSG